MHTVDRVLSLVKESGLTAKEFGEGAGLAGGSITDWKTGRSKPSVESLQKIAKYANVQLEWLTGDSDFKTIKDLFSNYYQIQYKIDLNNALIYNSAYLMASHLPLYIQDDIKKILLSILDKNTSSEEFSNKLNNYISSSAKGERKKIREYIKKIMVYLSDCNSDRQTFYSYIKLLENTHEPNTDTSYYKCPVYGRIAAGQPNWAEECLEGYLPIDPNLMNIIAPEEHFFLRVNRRKYEQSY